MNMNLYEIEKCGTLSSFPDFFKVCAMYSDPRLILLKICAVSLSGLQVQISWMKSGILILVNFVLSQSAEVITCRPTLICLRLQGTVSSYSSVVCPASLSRELGTEKLLGLF